MLVFESVGGRLFGMHVFGRIVLDRDVSRGNGVADRHVVDSEPKRFRKPSAAFQQPRGFTRHILLLQVINELRRLLAFRLADRLKDMRLRHPAEIVVDRRLPACLHHVEADRASEPIGMGDRRRPSVPWLNNRIDGERDAMGEEHLAADVIERKQEIPELIRVFRKILPPGLVPQFDLLRPDRIAEPLRLAELRALERHFQARIRPVDVEGLQDEDM